MRCVRSSPRPACVVAVATLVALIAGLLPVLAPPASAAASDGDVPELWRTYAPRVFFDPQERYLPTSVEHIVEHATLHSNGFAYTDLTVDSPELTAADPGDHLTIDTAAWGGMAPVAHPELSGHLLSEAPMYVTQETKADTIEITYWMVYAYNGCALAQVKSHGVWFARIWRSAVTEIFEWCPGGTHQGDIERVRVEVDRSTHQPISVTFRRHSKETTLAWNEVGKTGTHPHVFPGLNSHANYAAEGVHRTLTDGEANMFGLLYNGSQALAGVLHPLVGLSLLFGKTVQDVTMVDVNNRTATIADPPNRGRVVWEPWQRGEGLVAVEPGLAIWDFPGRWGPEQTNTPLHKLSKKRNNSHVELNAMRWAFALAMAQSGQKTVSGPDGPLHKDDVIVDSVVLAAAPLAGSIEVFVGDELLCEGDDCEVLMREHDRIEIVPVLDPATQFLAGWGGVCEATDGEACVVSHDDVSGRAAAAAVIDNIGIAAHGPGPTGTVSVWNDAGDQVCDRVEYCEADGRVGDTFTVEAHLDPDPEIEVRFLNWLNGCEGTSMTCEVTVDEPTRVAVDADVHFPLVVVERELDMNRSYLIEGHWEINKTKGAETLQLAHVRSSTDESVFAMANEPIVIVSEAQPGYDSHGASLESMELVLTRDTLGEGELTGSVDGHWERQWGYGHHNFTRTPGGWAIDGALDWESGDMHLFLDADDGLGSWRSAEVAFDAIWADSTITVDGPGRVEVLRGGEVVGTATASSPLTTTILSDQVVVTDDPVAVPASGWAVLAWLGSDGGVRLDSWSGDVAGVGTHIVSLPLGTGLDLAARMVGAEDNRWYTGEVAQGASRIGGKQGLYWGVGTVEVSGHEARLVSARLAAQVNHQMEAEFLEIGVLELSIDESGLLSTDHVAGTIRVDQHHPGRPPARHCRGGRRDRTARRRGRCARAGGRRRARRGSCRAGVSPRRWRGAVPRRLIHSVLLRRGAAGRRRVASAPWHGTSATERCTETSRSPTSARRSHS